MIEISFPLLIPGLYDKAYCFSSKFNWHKFFLNWLPELTILNTLFDIKRQS